MQDETRRAELDSFHTVLTDISHGATTDDVREFMIDAYVRGYEIATAAHVPFEGSTAVFTRRRYRDKWNRTVVRRIATKHNHSIKIRACVRPKGVRSGQWYAEDRVAFLRKKCQTQSLWNLHLAGALTGGYTKSPSHASSYFGTLPLAPSRKGDFHPSLETKPPTASRSHMMRVTALWKIHICKYTQRKRLCRGYVSKERPVPPQS